MRNRAGRVTTLAALTSLPGRHYGPRRGRPSEPGQGHVAFAQEPVGLTDEFAHDASRQALWLAFLKKNELPPEPLPAIVGRLSVALAPALNTVAR